MIARHENIDAPLWSRLSAELAKDAISWRQDGKPTQRDGKYVARFVAYTDAQVVRERLDEVVPGEWDLTLELLPHASDAEGEATCAFKARLQVLGVIREDVGTGTDYKSASTDAFKRAAVRFGIGHELYSMGQVWVTVDGDSKYAKALEDPATVYARKNGGHALAASERHGAPAAAKAPQQVGTAATAPTPAPLVDGQDEPCPKCGGKMWDNRLSKTNPKAPDFRCRNRSCDGVRWPEKPSGAARPAPQPVPGDEFPPLEDEVDDLPY